MTTLFTTQLGKFRILAFIEGVSFLVILFITMPLKYVLEIPLPNKIFGMLHGVLFILTKKNLQFSLKVIIRY